MKIAWLDLTEVKTFAASFVENFCRIRAGGMARGDKAVQIAKRFDKLLEDAAAFERARKLNFYKKAQLVSLVRSGLSERSIPADEIESVSQRLLGAPLVRVPGAGKTDI